MSVNAKMKKICDNIRLRTGDTALLNLDEIADAVLTIDGEVDRKLWVSKSVGATYAPSQKAAAPDVDGYDIDILNATADDVHTYIDDVVNGKASVTKEILGKDASGKYDIARYTYANREHCAWVKRNYPKMYAWKNGTAKMYTESVSPRVGDKAYDTPYVVESGTTTETVTVPAVVGFVYNKRYSQSGGAFSSSTTESSVIIPVEISSAITAGNPVTLEIKGGTKINSGRSIYYGSTNSTFPKTATASITAGSSIATITGMDAGKWFVDVTVTTASTGVSDAATVPNMTVAFGDVTIANIAIGAASAAHATTTTTEVETEGGTPITEVKVATVASGATTNTVPSSRVIGGLEYVRSSADDVEPTVIYTDADDSRNGNASITQDGVTYNRYPLGDLGANRTKLTPIFIYANEHGVIKDITSKETYETKLCALVAARFLRDLAAGRQMHNPLYKFIRESCMLIVIPVANPYGYNYSLTTDTNSAGTGYHNFNSVNINRNYDTAGWVISKNKGEGHHGSYPGSENETQYIMNTMVESGAVVAMSLHGMGGTLGNKINGVWEVIYSAIQGQNPDGTDYNRESYGKVKAFLKEQYNRTMGYYDTHLEVGTTDPLYGTVYPCQAMPSFTCKSPSYITQCGAYGGIVEFSPDGDEGDGVFKQEMKPHVIEAAYAQMLNLTAMWLNDYLAG